MSGFRVAQAQIAQTVVQATLDAEQTAPGGVTQLPWAYHITEISQVLLGCSRQWKGTFFGGSAEE